MSNARSFNPRVTVATVVARDGEYLMVEERVRERLVFNQPAGHLEAGETLIEAAVRETLEETGYRVRIDGVIGIYQWTGPGGRHYVRTAFAATALEHDPEAPLDEGIIAAHWLDREALGRLDGRLRNPLVLKIVDDFAAGAIYPLSLVQSAPS